MLFPSLACRGLIFVIDILTNLYHNIMYTLPKEDKPIKSLRRILLFITTLLVALFHLVKSIVLSLVDYKKVLTLLYIAIFYPIILGCCSLLPFIPQVDIFLNSIVNGTALDLLSANIGSFIIIGVCVLAISLFINGLLELIAYFLHIEQWFIQVFELQQSCCSAQMTIASFAALWIAATMNNFSQSSEANKMLLGISIFLFICSLLTSAYRYFLYSKKAVPTIYKNAMQDWNAYKD